jgi:hypothetical protein
MQKCLGSKPPLQNLMPAGLTLGNDLKITYKYNQLALSKHLQHLIKNKLKSLIKESIEFFLWQKQFKEGKT